jgi:transposase-like protein
MNHQELNICPQINFTCDSCGKQFQQETAYSPASNLEELEHQPTYCINCVNITKEGSEKRVQVETKKSKS